MTRRGNSSYHGFMKWVLRMYSTLGVAAAMLASAGAAHARELCPPAYASLCGFAKGFSGNAGGVVGTIIQVLIIIAAITSLFFLIFGGARYITAAGDQGKTAQARAHIIASIVGLIISLSAFLIVNVIMTLITGQGVSGMQLPKL